MKFSIKSQLFFVMTLVFVLVIAYFGYSALPRLDSVEQSAEQLSADSDVDVVTDRGFKTDTVQADLVRPLYNEIVKFDRNGFKPKDMTIERNKVLRFENTDVSDLVFVLNGTSFQIFRGVPIDLPMNGDETGPGKYRVYLKDYPDGTFDLTIL